MPKKKRGSNLSVKPGGKDRNTSTTSHLHYYSASYNVSIISNATTIRNPAEEPPSNVVKAIEQAERIFDLKRTINRKEEKYIKMRQKMVAAVENDVTTKVKAVKEVTEVKNESKRAKVDAHAANVRADAAEVREHTLKMQAQEAID